MNGAEPADGDLDLPTRPPAQPDPLQQWIARVDGEALARFARTLWQEI